VINDFLTVPKRRAVIIQKYIKNPLLLGGLKWDLRIYVFVTSFSPLVAYICDDGLVRFSTEKYSLNTKNRYVHLTNYSINKKSKKFRQNHDASSTEGHKWSMKILWGELKKEGHNTDKIWEDIKDVVLKTLIAAEGHIVQQVHKHCASQENCYELFGFDIMLDRNGSVILLEVNVSPSLHSNSKLDQDIKGNLIADIFNTTGFTPYKPKSPPVVTSADRQANARLFQRCHDMKNLELLTQMSSYHRYLVLKYECERMRKGNLHRLIPKPGTWQKYKRFFDTMRVDNAVLAAFEDEYGDSELKRKNGAEKIYQVHCINQSKIS
jgi:tubulin polyglutamylase TTLL4